MNSLRITDVKVIKNSEDVVSMVVFRDQVFVAKQDGVYRLVGDELQPLTFVDAPITSEGKA